MVKYSFLDKQIYHPETSMDIDTITQSLPTLIADLLGKEGLNIDNLFADLWKRMGVATYLL